MAEQASSETSITWEGRTYNFENPVELNSFVSTVFRSVLGFPRPLPSVRSVAAVALGVSSLILAGGGALSISLSDWLWFARSGSLCIVVGTLLIFYDVSGYYENSLAAIARWHQFLALGLDQLRRRIADDHELPQEQRQEILMNLEKLSRRQVEAHVPPTDHLEVRQEARLLEGKVRLVEATILITGTIVWGFGDLVGLMLKALQ